MNIEEACKVDMNVHDCEIWIFDEKNAKIDKL